MLKDIRQLGKDFKRCFTEIKTWSEITFDSNDKTELSKLENVAEVDEVSDHSITFHFSNNNHCIVPSQYLLYAIFIKEFAIALRDHLEVFDTFKTGKSRNDVAEEISSNRWNLSSQNLDLWSSMIALKPITDDEYKFGAKSIINGEAGDYTIRQTSDFFGSIVRKIINVPDASSEILGRIIFDLAGKKKLYSYLEKRFYKKLPFLIKERNSDWFAYRLFSYLLQYDGLNNLKNFINIDSNFASIMLQGTSLPNVFKLSKEVEQEEGLKIDGEIVFFSAPLYLNPDNDQYYYFSKNWSVDENNHLNINNLTSIVERYYPEFQIVSENGFFILRANNTPQIKRAIIQTDFKLDRLIAAISLTGLTFNSQLICRFCSSLLTKPFVILTGLSGSGKTKMAQAFAQWICQDESQYEIVAVGADWTNREPLLGYPNALNVEEYIKPDNGALDLILNATSHPDLPYFLILDEMNLSHVERYFADFLSVMESKDEISLCGNDSVKNGIPTNLKIPPNLFIIGTVNIDETTNMFSPKVLDRANTIEFRVTAKEMIDFLTNAKEINLETLNTRGASMAKSFLEMSFTKSFLRDDADTINTILVVFFKELKKTGAEFGYRSATEILLLIEKLGTLDATLTVEEKIDIAIMQKLLPKLHGSRRKLSPVLEKLGTFCFRADGITEIKNAFGKEDYDLEQQNVKYPLSLEKITRMYKGAIDNGFSSFAEA